MDFARYHQAVDYLQRYLWQQLPSVPVERALQSRIRTLLSHYGEPHEAFPVVHVGGSAGKGSTAAITASILRAAGLRTGLYTSPHLQTFIERVDVDGTLVAPDAFAEAVLALDPLVRKMHMDVLDGIGHGRPSLVEVPFAVGMKHFAEERVDAAVVEVGLGGRTDCTNVFEDATVRVITNVELEHRERLGQTAAAIAREKAGIIHGGTVVTGARGAALRVIEGRCEETGARLWRLGREIVMTSIVAGGGATAFDLRTPMGAFDGLRVSLAGVHQATNAALAVTAALTFGAARGVRIDEPAIRAGLAEVRISARLETVQREPTVVLDSAHNPAEARALAAALSAHWPMAVNQRALIIGVLADKDQAAMAKALGGVAGRVIVTQPPLGERTGDPQRLLSHFSRVLGDDAVTYEPSPERALDIALDHCPSGGMICVAGSMFLAGALRGRWVPEQRILEQRTAQLTNT